MSATTASHSATSPKGASRTKTPFMAMETKTLCLMIRSAARERTIAALIYMLSGGHTTA